ncbi:MAG: hypothetical protein WCS43_18600 [Verrucomicrobiota bacterium]
MKIRLYLLLSFAMAMVCGVAQAQKRTPSKTPAKTPSVAPVAPAVTPPAAPPSGGTAGKPVSEASDVMSELVPPEVETSAVAAVAKLGDEVVLGHYQVAVERMYPVWKKREAEREGGMDVLEKKLASVGVTMVQMGISLISFKPQGKPRAYEVVPGTKVVKENGASVEKLVFTKWMVLVPTVRKIRIQRKDGLKPAVIESTGFQVAICDKGKNDWTFIDGAGLKASDLRGLFVTLPQNLALPPVEEHESQ